MNASKRISKAGSIAIDTSAVVSLFRGYPGAAACFNEAREIWLPVTVLGELYCGLRKCNNPEKERHRVSQVRARSLIRGIDEGTAMLYGEVYTRLEAAGSMIPLNDIWIAAFAIHHEIPLLARDDHFIRIEGLDLIAL